MVSGNYTDKMSQINTLEFAVHCESTRVGPGSGRREITRSYGQMCVTYVGGEAISDETEMNTKRSGFDGGRKRTLRRRSHRDDARGTFHMSVPEVFPYTPGHPYSVLRVLQIVAGDILLVKSAGISYDG